MTKKNISKKAFVKAIAGISAVLIVAAPMATETASVFGNTRPAIVMEASAASSSSGKRTGKSKVYVSCIGYRKNAVTICMNTDKDVNGMIRLLDNVSFWTSGAKNGKMVIDFAGYLPGMKLSGADKLVLKQVAKIFSSANGVSKSAKKAAADMRAMNKKYPKNGIKLTIRENGYWIVEKQ